MLQWKHFCNVNAKTRGSSLQTLRGGFIYQGEFWSCLNFLAFEEKLNSKTTKMQMLANLSFLTLSPTSDLSSPNCFVGSFKISASIYTCGSHLVLCHPRSDTWATAACADISPLGKKQPVLLLAADCYVLQGWPAGRQHRAGNHRAHSGAVEFVSISNFHKAHRN